MRLRDWRISKGLSAAELARALGISNANPARTIGRYETGENTIPAQIAALIVRHSDGAVTHTDMHETRLAWLLQRKRAA